MKRAILWSVACILVIAAVVMNGWTSVSGGWITIALAVLCAGLQWLVYVKQNRNRRK
jgi:hypothetical protein